MMQPRRNPRPKRPKERPSRELVQRIYNEIHSIERKSDEQSRREDRYKLVLNEFCRPSTRELHNRFFPKTRIGFTQAGYFRHLIESDVIKNKINGYVGSNLEERNKIVGQLIREIENAREDIIISFDNIQTFTYTPDGRRMSPKIEEAVFNLLGNSSTILVGNFSRLLIEVQKLQGKR